MKKLTALLMVALFSIGVFAATAKAETGPKPKIGMAKATQIARTRARGLTLKAKELEHENGRWIYSFEFKNKDGSIREVNVNAYTGKVIGVERENGKKEAAEEKDEKKEKN
ncbi:MAG: PepSY domain-containing protein [Pyrinomonadaceae bacterium]